MIFLRTLAVFGMVCFCVNCSQGKSNSERGGGAASSDGNGTIQVTGVLTVEAKYSNSSDLLQRKEVNIEDSSGVEVAKGFSDANGAFSVAMPGQLAVDSSPASLNLVSGYKVVSLIEDDGDGKVLGVKQDISISRAQAAEGTVKLGTFPFSEIAAIKGIVRFVNADGSENTSVNKIGTDVYLPGFSLVAKTDAAGKFLILYIPPGQYTVRIEKGSMQKELDAEVVANTTLNLGTVDVLADTIPPITSTSKESTDFRNPLCLGLTADDSNAIIYFTVDGSTPTATQPFRYDAVTKTTCGATADCSICIENRSTTVKFFSVDAAGNAEDMKAKFYFYNEKWADPDDTTSPLTKVFVDSAEVTEDSAVSAKPVIISLSANEGANIYYTLDGTTPTTGSGVYSTPLEIKQTTEIKYFSVDWAFNAETVKTKQIRVYRWHKKETSSKSAPSFVKFYTSAASFERPVSLVYDSSKASNKLLAFGYAGEVSSQISNCNGGSEAAQMAVFETYEFDGSTWTKIDTLQSTGRITSNDYRKTIVFYDTAFDRPIALVLVVEQGCNGTSPTTTAKLNHYYFEPNRRLSKWVSFSPADTDTAAPQGGTLADMGSLSAAFSSYSKKTVVLGRGSDGLGKLRVIDFSGSSAGSWSKKSATGAIFSLKKPNFGDLVYHEQGRKFVYVGGGDSGSDIIGGDGLTYELPEGQLLETSPATDNFTTLTSVPTTGPAAVYMPTLNTILAFGGIENVSVPSLISNTTWIYFDTDPDQPNWIEAPQDVRPSARVNPSMTYDPDSDSVWLFGGVSRSGALLLDTWQFTY